MFRPIGASFLAVVGAMALLPGVYAAGPVVEASFFPVVTPAVLSNGKGTRDGMSFYARFEKLRQCEFVALVWYQGNVRLTVDFEPEAEDAPAMRPVGGQYSGPWHVHGLFDLSRSEAFSYHRCHPLWTTITRFYDGQAPEDEEMQDAG